MPVLKDAATGKFVASAEVVADLLSSPKGRAELEAALTGKAAVDVSRLADRAYLATLTPEQVAENWTAILNADSAAHEAAAQEATR